MAKQTGAIKITGTIDNTCFYKMNGTYYARKKSTLNGKRVKKDKAFAETMQYAKRMAKASGIASKIYRQIMRKEKNRKLFQQLTGKAMRLLKEGRTEKEIYELLGNKG